MSLQTSNWNYLGEQIYKKFEICQMLWSPSIIIDDYNIYSATFGGPIALISKEQLLRKSNHYNVNIYSSMGQLLSNVIISANIIALGWSHKEDLISVQSNGMISLYDMFGQHITTLTLDQEIRDLKIIDCRIFQTINRTGVAILTSSFSFYLYNNLYDLKMRKLPEIPYFNSPPLAWDVISLENDTQIIVSRKKGLIILKSYDLSCIIKEDWKETITMISVSFDSSHVALFVENGKLFLTKTENDLAMNYYSVFDTESKTNPKQLVWCGNEVLAAHWANLIFVVDLHKNWLKYPTYGNVYMIQELDCIRVIDYHTQEIFTKVINDAVSVFKIGSCSSGAYLLEASRMFDQQNHKVDDYIRLIQEKNEMEMAIKMCLETACHEFNISTQKTLLRAASFGQCLTKNSDPNRFRKICGQLRILNAIRQPEIGIPLTYIQLEKITNHLLINRLIERHHFLFALKLAEYLKIPAEDGSIKILTKWAFYKIRQLEINEDEIAEQIANKIPTNSGVSFAEIANKTIEYGRKQLAIKLLDYELKVTDQVPLLLKLNEYRRALQRAIESGNTNLIYMVVLSYKNVQTPEQFYLGIRHYPVAYSLYRKYCNQNDKKLLRDIYFQEKDVISEGLTYLEECVLQKNLATQADYKKNKMSLVCSAMDTLKKGRNEFISTHIDEYSRLLKCQLKLETKFPTIKFFDLSLHETMRRLLQNREYKFCEDMKKEFKVPDKRYYYLRLITLAEMNEWAEIERMSKTKKSPIGYEPFVDVCVQHRNPNEAQKYLPKIRDENKIKYCIKAGNLEEAAKYALRTKDIPALDYIMTKAGNNEQFLEKVRSMKSQLGS